MSENPARRALSIWSFAVLLLGNTPEKVPDALAPYVVDGELKTDDFGWMRGQFDGADDKQKADSKTIQDWLRQCLVNAKTKALDNLKALGIANAKLDGVAIGPTLCGSLASFNSMAQTDNKNWEEFVVNERKARELFAAYQFGAKTAVQHMPYEKAWGNEEAWDLLGATVMDQVNRNGSRWAYNVKTNTLDPALLPYLAAHFMNAGTSTDRKNTVFLKKLVEKKGWPTIPMVGERASSNAWLLVQHADHDPAFQLTALRLMEPLVSKGEVRKGDYAYLYDRIMLKLSGKQRYGTQVECVKGKWQPRPLEKDVAVSSDALDTVRKSVELESITKYLGGFQKRSPNCI
ncbi:MAG TPA: DUF6624 domain-containing protein [Sphingorhabdus sp.]|nr:DUF6624 domain-containing protein [Sphingorhabdus sp.]